MKKYIFMLIAMMAMASTTEAQTVYIAPSKSAIAYHKSKDCSYLRNSSNVTAIKQGEATDMGRHACVRCYPEKKSQTMKEIAKENKTKKTEAKAPANVYITSAKGATAYHKNKNCTYLKKAPSVEAISLNKAEDMKRLPCKVCFPSGSTTKKSETKKKETTTTKKEPTAAKKETAAKKAKETKKTTKATPERDEKGRFVKKTATETTAAKKKATPERDEKGRFVKKAKNDTKDEPAKKAATKKTTTKKTTTKKAA